MRITIGTQQRSFLRTERTETVEIPVTSATVFKYNFPIVGNLKNAIVTGFELLTGSFATPNNFQLIGNADLARTYVTLINKDDHSQLTRIALYSLLNAPGTIKQLNFMEIDWENSFIEIINYTGAPSPAPAGKAYGFVVHYTQKSNYDSLVARVNQFTQLFARMK